MKGKILSIGLAIFCCFSLPSKAQVIPEALIVGKSGALSETDNKEFTATKTIRFEGGFCTKPGSVFKAYIVEAVDNFSSNIPDILTYPNPSSLTVTILGRFDKTVVTIYDFMGIKVMDAVIEGENPSLDISELKRGQYTISVDRKTARLVKE